MAAQWYKVPTGGQVTFTLSEYWGIRKAPPPDNLNLGDASLTLEYSDGTTQLIAFQNSGTAAWLFLTNNAGEFDGIGSWAQTAFLPEGSTFRIASSSPAQSYDPQLTFQGGQEGAYVNGVVNKFSTDAPPVTQPSEPSTTSNVPPPSAPAGGPSNIHAVIVSGLSDPAKVIVSSNVTLTGGIVALGKNGSPPSASSAWSPRLKIIPDYGLLTGEKIPPVTPNIIDVRIVRQDVTADFPSPSSKPDN